MYVRTALIYKSIFVCYSAEKDEVYACRALSFGEATRCFERNNIDFYIITDLNTHVEPTEIPVAQDDGSLLDYTPRWVS